MRHLTPTWTEQRMRRRSCIARIYKTIQSRTVLEAIDISRRIGCKCFTTFSDNCVPKWYRGFCVPMIGSQYWKALIHDALWFFSKWYAYTGLKNNIYQINSSRDWRNCWPVIRERKTPQIIAIKPGLTMMCSLKYLELSQTQNSGYSSHLCISLIWKSFQVTLILSMKIWTDNLPRLENHCISSVMMLFWEV